MKITGNLTSFNAGEISPLMAGRTDVRFYTTAARKMRNFIPTPQGPVRRRPGTRFVAEVKNSANRVWIKPWVTDGRIAYVMEIGDKYIRFFANHGVVGAPFELLTPWALADLTQADGTCALRMVQTGDVMYVVSTYGTYPPQIITRTGSATWTVIPMPFNDGPFADVNPDATIDIYSSGTGSGGTVTLTASAPFFTGPGTPTNVGELFYMEQKYADGVKFWEPGKIVAIGDIRRSDSKNYKALTAGTTGSVKPTHSSHYGAAVRVAKYDGDAGVQWEFQDPGYGWGVIVGVTDSTHAQMNVLGWLPAGIVGAGNGTTRYAFGALSNRKGWPDSVAIHRERLVFMRKREFWASVAGDFSSWAQKDNGVVTAQDCVSITAYTNTADPVKWLMPQNQALMLGTGSDESVITEATYNEVFGPGNTALHKQSQYGSNGVMPVQVGDGILFVSKSGRVLRDMKAAESVDAKWVANNMTVLAEHVTKSGIVDMGYASDPESILWTVLANGKLVGFTLDREQEVHGWHPHRLGGFNDSISQNPAFVESVAVIPVGDRDEVWLAVRRYVNGVFKRYIEYIEYHHEANDDPKDSFYVDCGLSLNNSITTGDLYLGAGWDQPGTIIEIFSNDFPANTFFTAASVGQYIQVPFAYLDPSGTGKVLYSMGAALITAFQTGGRVTAKVVKPFPQQYYAKTTAGQWRITVQKIFGMTHLIGQTVSVLADGAMHPDVVVAADGSIALQWPAARVHVGLRARAVLQPMPIEPNTPGSTRGHKKRANKVTVKLQETGGGKYGRDEDTQLDYFQYRHGNYRMSEALPLFTGDMTVPWPDGSDEELALTIIQDEPFPMTILSLAPHMNVEEAP